MSILKLWFPEDFDKRYTEYHKKFPEQKNRLEPFLLERLFDEVENIGKINNEAEYEEEIQKWEPFKVILDAINKELSPLANEAQSVKVDLKKIGLSENIAKYPLLTLVQEGVCRWRITSPGIISSVPVSEYLSGEGVIVQDYKKFRDFRTRINEFISSIRKQKEDKFPKVKLEIEEKNQGKVFSSNSFSLKESPLIFIDDEAKLKVNEIECEMPPYKSEHYLCRVMFDNKHPVKKAVDWEEVFSEMEQLPYKAIGRDTKKDMKSVQDTMYALNKRIRDTFNTKDDLFSWKNKCVVRNF